MTCEAINMSADFLAHRGRRLFTVTIQPAEATAQGSILFLHPFAEEMHKSRRTVAEQARRFAGLGFNVVLLDLSGCGDSSGEFANCSWSDWIEDAEFALNHIDRQWGVPIVVWGLRLGALLAADVSQKSEVVQKLLLWQPTLNGEQHIDEFLRTQSAGLALKGESGFNRAELWDELRAGRSLNVAGYDVSPTLATQISKIRLHDIKPRCPVTWINIGRIANAIPNPASQNVLSGWEGEAIEVEFENMEGELFWRILDAGESKRLLDRTAELLGCV